MLHSMPLSKGLFLIALGAVITLSPGCRGRKPEAAPEPFGPIRPVADIRRDAAALTGQVVRVRGRLKEIRNLNPGQRFPWDVVYTVEDGSNSIPVHWFTQEKRPPELKPPSLPGGQVIVT